MHEHSQPQTTPIVGHHPGWGLGGGQPIRPYELTPGSIDTLAVRVREKIDVHGVGTDVVDMRGTFTVRRDDPCAVQDVESVWYDTRLPARVGLPAPVKTLLEGLASPTMFGPTLSGPTLFGRS